MPIKGNVGKKNLTKQALENDIEKLYLFTTACVKCV